MKYFSIFIFIFSSHAVAYPCSQMSDAVVSKVLSLIEASDSESKSHQLNILWRDKSETATEAIIRVMDLNLEGHDFEFNLCEIYSRGEVAINLLSDHSVCLDPTIMDSKYLINNKQWSESKRLQHREKVLGNIKSKSEGACLYM